MKYVKETTRFFWPFLRTILSPQYVGYLVSRWAYNVFESAIWRIRIEAASSARIHPTASIRNPQNVKVGNNSHINLNCCLWAGKTSQIILGDNLLMGPCVQLHAGRHGMALGTPMTFQPREDEDIVIGDDVWLCAGCIVTAGVTIANGVVVAANAVVTKTIAEENVIVGGVPAKIIGYRRAVRGGDAENRDTSM
jgi:acetyltransferase-like isoleucine patch superfamily enzyme